MTDLTVLPYYVTCNAKENRGLKVEKVAFQLLEYVGTHRTQDRVLSVPYSACHVHGVPRKTEQV